jgi:hypothetical protein
MTPMRTATFFPDDWSTHPLRRIREMARDALAPMRPLFVAMASTWTGTPAPDRALMAILLMTLYGIRSEALFCEALEEKPLFRWFLEMTPFDGPLEAGPLAQMRSRLVRNSAAVEFFERTLGEASNAGLLADTYFTPDAQQIAIWSKGTVVLAAGGPRE